MRGWQTPRVDSLKLANYPRIENAHKIRKKIFVFYYVAVICTITKRKKTNTGRGVVLKNEVWERRSLTRIKLL